MSKSESYKILLGFTQQDMAIVLKTSRPQFAKYQLGIGNIPLASRLLLGEIIQFMCGPEPKTTGLAEQEAEKQTALTRMLKENKYQLLHTEREIESLERKYSINLKALQLAEFLKLRTDSSQTDELAVLRHITNKANKALKGKGLAALFKLKIKLELLKREKELLEAETGN